MIVVHSKRKSMVCGVLLLQYDLYICDTIEPVDICNLLPYESVLLYNSRIQLVLRLRATFPSEAQKI